MKSIVGYIQNRGDAIPSKDEAIIWGVDFRAIDPDDESEFYKVKSLDDICFPYGDLDAVLSKPEYKGHIHRLYSDYHKMIIGYAVFGPIFVDNSGYILRIGTHPDFRRKGIASTILGYIRTQLKFNKSPGVFADVRSSNIASQRLFESEGFKIAEKRNGIYEDGELSFLYYFNLRSK